MLGRVILGVLVALASMAFAEPAPRPTFAVIRSRPGINVVESVNQARHVHGGAAATIGHVSLNVVVTNTKPHTVSVKKLELLRGHCRTTKWESRTALEVTGYELTYWDSADPIASGKTSISLPAKRDLYQVSVAFDGVGVYQACDRFAFGVKLVVDRKPVALEVPLEVTRFEPLRRP